MRVRAQMSMLFHLDKCIGCHTCSVACKNLWTDRQGAEYMWWNNVETRPGTGYPTGWEDQEHYNGGWRRDAKGRLHLKLHNKPTGIARLFFNPSLPQIEDYYEPFTFTYRDLFTAPEGDQQPTARPISMITGDEMDIEAGPNWDDDLGGSGVYARHDPALEGVDDDIRAQLEEIERVVFNYLPRICNHCLNPSCVAACPSGAIYKRGEDGIVLVNEDKCRAWRMCVAACPYKKVYYNWSTGKSEKCILCFPRMETGQAPACAHSCVGRIRYMGVLLYDADQIAAAAAAPDDELIARQLDSILDPWDARVVTAAKAAGIDDGWIEAARNSPAWKFVKEWGLALPLRAEFRTMAMMFYIPPLSPVVSTIERNLTRLDLPAERVDFELFDELDKARLPIKYLANLFSVGDEDTIRAVLRKMLAVRIYKRRQSVDGSIDDATLALLDSAGTNETEVEAIYRLTTLPTLEERFVLPPYHREMSIEQVNDPLAHKGATGVGYLEAPREGGVMGAAEIIAQCFAYPQEGGLARLASGVAGLVDGKVRSHLQRFLAAVRSLSLGEWEELHTRTLDLSPHFVPYVGHVVWGESYKRGAFMAELKRAMTAAGVDLGGELPDHLAPILRLLGADASPPGELVEVLPKAVTAMQRELAKSDGDNPYRHVLAAVRAQVAIEARLEIGSSHALQ